MYMVLRFIYELTLNASLFGQKLWMFSYSILHIWFFLLVVLESPARRKRRKNYLFTKFRSSHQKCSIKKLFLKHVLESYFNKVAGLKAKKKRIPTQVISCDYCQKNLCWSLFLIKLQNWKSRKKATPTQLFSWEYCKIFKSNYFEEDLRTADSENLIMKMKSNQFPPLNTILVYQ